MNILSIDTATSPHSIALLKEGHIFATNLDNTTQSDLLFLEINLLLQKANIDYKDLDKILCTIGPGSFTGIRVGIAAIRGVKKIFPNLTIIGFTTLELIAFLRNKHTQKHNDFYTAINAFSDDLYLQKYDLNTLALSEILVLPKWHLTNNVTSESVVSNDDQLVKFFDNNHIDTQFVQYDATTLLEYHQKFPERNQQVKPLYIKKPNIHHGAIKQPQ